MGRTIRELAHWDVAFQLFTLAIIRRHSLSSGASLHFSGPYDGVVRARAKRFEGLREGVLR